MEITRKGFLRMGLVAAGGLLAPSWLLAKGKEAALQYLLGKSMKATKGAGNPAMLKELIVAELS